MAEGRDRRRLTRYVVDAQVDIINQLTGEKLGLLVDIHAEGLMLMGEGMSADRIYQVMLKPSGKAEMIDEFGLGIDCLWTREMLHGGHSWFGCKIIDASSDALKKIEQIIELFGRREAL